VETTSLLTVVRWNTIVKLAISNRVMTYSGPILRTEKPGVGEESGLLTKPGVCAQNPSWTLPMVASSRRSAV